MADPNFADQMMNDIKDLIPKTPEESRAASRSNPVGQWFEDFSSGNMFERIHGFEGTENLYSGMVDKKGGSDFVTSTSYLGVIAKFVRAIFTYGDDSAVDADPIYNVQEGKPDITTGGTNTPSIISLDGSTLQTRIESVFKYYSAKTQWMNGQMKDIGALLSGLSGQMENFQKQQEEQNQNQEEQNQNQEGQNQKLGENIDQIGKDIQDLSNKISELDKLLKASVAHQTLLEKDIIKNHNDISDIKKHVKMS